jgi:hypothetical protein
LVTELNFPLKGTMTAASTTHKPITNHGTHRPAKRLRGASTDGAVLTAIPLPPTHGSHRSSDAEFVPSEPETIINAALRPIDRSPAVQDQEGLPGQLGDDVQGEFDLFGCPADEFANLR